MKDHQNVTIGMLLATALILGALLVGTYTQQASAVGTSVQAGRFILATGQVSGTMDYLYVIDLSSGMMNMYGVSPASKRLEIGQPVDLKKLFTTKS